MKLQSLHIVSYKNLNNLTIEFDQDSLVNVFVGKNATGKSNLLEAILEIFRELSEEDYTTTFDYRIEYQINDNKVEVLRSAGVTTINGEDLKKASESLLPEHLILYYTGHNNSILEVTEAYAQAYQKKLGKNHKNVFKRFIGIDDVHTDNLLLSIALQQGNHTAISALVERLGIDSFGDEVVLALNRPDYARESSRNKYQVDRLDDETKFWKVGGDTRVFLDILDSVKSSSKGEKLRDEGYNATDGNNDYYLLYLESKDLRSKLKHLSSLDIFRSFDNLVALGMLDYASIDINLKNGNTIDSTMLSDGQYQSMIILGIAEVFKSRNSLVLMDEPDSFLHPEWQSDFLTQVNSVSAEAQNTNHIIITSHSGVSLIGHNGQIRILRYNDAGALICHPVNKSYAIGQLSAHLMNYSEDEQMISILNKVRLQKKPILFTEGYTDPIILNIAWSKLYDEPCPFHIVFSFGCENLRRTIQEEKILNELEGLPIFGLFDFDTAYNEWNGVSFEAEIETDPYVGLCRKVTAKESYAMLIPIPNIDSIKAQVINPEGDTFRGESTVEIEHLFYGDKETHGYFTSVTKPGGNQILEFKVSSKTEFASNIVPHIHANHFEVFRPMFDFIRGKC